MSWNRAYLEIGSVNGHDGAFTPNLKSIELDAWNYALFRNMDERGKLSNDLRGGNISFFVTGVPKILFLDWMLTANKYLSGQVVLKNDEGEKADEIKFYNAACINLKIRYMNEGAAYMSVEGTIQAEKLFFDNTTKLDNHWTEIPWINSSVCTGTVEEIMSTVIGNAGVGAIEGHWDPDGTEAYNDDYQLQSFEMEFIRDVNYNGQPQYEVKGGIATLSLYRYPTKEINQWIRNTDRKGGHFRFGDKENGSKLKIKYEEAICTGSYIGTDNFSQDHITTRINLLPRSLDFENGITFEVPYK